MENNKESSTIVQVKNMLETDRINKRFFDILGDKTPQFKASIINAVSQNWSLKKCNANSILAASIVAATYDLPIDSNLGFSALVPYWNGKTREYLAQFQIMYKGFIQLAIRSGSYKTINYSSVYEDEILSYNPIFKNIEFVSIFDNCTQRKNKEKDKMAGYLAWFELKTGFRQEFYMTKEDVREHAMKYSQAYRNDLNKNTNNSLWSTDFEAMALKTVVKLLLSKWGILSIDMQKAIQDDQKIFDKNGDEFYLDNPKNNKLDLIEDETVDLFELERGEEE